VIISVAATPREFEDAGADDCVIVVDVFRASTTITTALAAGARFVLPVADVEQAVRLIEPYGPGEALLGGERDCRRIDGFDLGNSPREYTRETVGGKVIVFTTTNGTAALLTAAGAGAVLVGCFLNVSATATAAATWPRVTVLCAGNAGELSLEDFVCAGSLVDRLAGRSDDLNDAALGARAAFRQFGRTLTRSLLGSRHARRLVELSFRPDLEYALRTDTVTVVPRLKEGRLVAE
jgi:2-phosphosulfolactate phosphatase